MLFLYFMLGIFVGFTMSIVVIKANLNKSGVGNCKMCNSCPYKIKGVKKNEDAM